MGLNGYQWAVLFAAWLGWGFDVFDGLLFNYVAPNCVPTLLHIPLGTPAAKAASQYWTGLLTSVLLLSWALGGVLFGRLADRIGRTKTLLLTMLLYALGTAACAFAPNISVLLVCRIIGGLGIGGEWAAGAAMVAEVVPERRRVEAGALLYTSAPVGLFLASFVVHEIARVLYPAHPEVSWRYIFLCGLVPAGVALLVRLFVREPERWQSATEDAAHPRLSELFAGPNLRLTVSGFIPALTVLIAWWSCNAFIPGVATGLAQETAKAQGLTKLATTTLAEDWKLLATSAFNWGGLLGTLLTIPAAKYLGRRAMFAVYFVLQRRRLVPDVRSAPRAPHPPVRLLLHRPDGVRHLRRVHLLPAGTVPHPPARHRRGLLLQHRPRGRRRRPVPGRHYRRARRTDHPPDPLLDRRRPPDRPLLPALGD